MDSSGSPLPELEPEPSETDQRHEHAPGGYRELMELALPFILSSSFTTIQLFIDRVFIAKVGQAAIAATMPTVGYFWSPLVLFQFTVMYVTVFVAQYRGAGRPRRVGPIVWQGIYLGLAFGLAFPLLIPIVDWFISISNHAADVQHLERVYFRGLSFAALPMILVGAANGFFAGRQQSWTVLLINATGALVNALVAVPLILWRASDPEAAMFNAGLAAAIGSSVSALLGLVLLFRRRYEEEYATRSGWRFDWALTRRLLYFGLPNGAQFCIEGIAFTAFIILIGGLGSAELAATNLTFSLNLLAFLPVYGLGQGVEVLVGKRQGENRPDISARTTHRGVILGTCYMVLVGIVYCTLPQTLAWPFFAGAEHSTDWAEVAPLIPILLRFVAAYSLADAANIIYAFALRGAGDTRFVSLVAIGVSWPVMVLPTFLCVLYGWGLLAAWCFATAYVVVLAIIFWRRFLGGRWRTMKVIEPHVAD